MQEAYELIATLLNLPVIKALSLLASIVGAGVALLSLRRVNKVADAQLANFRADHTRYLNEQRSRIDLVTLNNDTTAKLVAAAFGRADAEAAKREALHCLYLNLLASAHSAWSNHLIDRADYEKHMDFFFEDFKGDHAELAAVLAYNHFAPGFDAECRKRLEARKVRDTKVAHKD
jgi:hypothetical protein